MGADREAACRGPLRTIAAIHPRGRRPDSDSMCSRRDRTARTCRGARRATCGGPSCLAAANSCATRTSNTTCRARSACSPDPPLARRAITSREARSRRTEQSLRVDHHEEALPGSGGDGCPANAQRRPPGRSRAARRALATPAISASVRVGRQRRAAVEFLAHGASQLLADRQPVGSIRVRKARFVR
jgi:hypothetical protein